MDIIRNDLREMRQELVEIRTERENLRRDLSQLRQQHTLQDSFAIKDRIQDKVNQEFPSNHSPSPQAKIELILSVTGNELSGPELSHYKKVVNALYRRKREDWSEKFSNKVEAHFYKRDDHSVLGSSDIEPLLCNISNLVPTIASKVNDGRSITPAEMIDIQMKLEDWLHQEFKIWRVLEGEEENDLCASHRKRLCERVKMMEELENPNDSMVIDLTHE